MMIAVAISGGPCGGEPDTSVLLQIAALVNELAGDPAHVVPWRDDDGRLADEGAHRDEAAAHESEAGRVAVVIVPATRVPLIRRSADAGPIVVVTDDDLATVLLAAKTLTALARAGHPSAAGRVVLGGAGRLPNLCPLLMAAGIGDLTMWNQRNAAVTALPDVAYGAHVVIDLIAGWPARHGGRATPQTCSTEPTEPVVIKPDYDRSRHLLLPGLVRALARNPTAEVKIDVLHACVLALVDATSPDRDLPDTGSLALTETVAAYAGRILSEKLVE